MADAAKAAWVNRAMETGYARAGRGPDLYDCWGLVDATGRRFGWRLPPDPVCSAGSVSGVRGLFAEHLAVGTWTRLGRACDGAVAFVPRRQGAVHAGIVILGRVLHTRAGLGPAHEPLSHPVWRHAEYATWAP